MLVGGDEVVSEGAFRSELLPEEALRTFTVAQRWFGAKSRELAGLRILDRAELRSAPPALSVLLVEVRYQSGSPDVYQLVVGAREGSGPPQATLASAEGWTSYEAFGDPEFARELCERLRAGGVLAADEGTIEFGSLGGFPSGGGELPRVRVLGLEQSNSSIVFDDELIVKVYRRVEAGVNPELELLGFFGRHGFENVPRLWGWWSYTGPLMRASLGVVQQFVPGAVDGWTLALDELRSEPEAFLGRLRRLGVVIGEMHAVLASERDDPAFAPEEASSESLALIAAAVAEEIEQVFGALPEGDSVAPLVGRGEELRDLLRRLSSGGSMGWRTGTHGDLHLGQLLWAHGDWLVIDFEGEPARPLPERRRKRSPLRDVAGLLRSFSYATSVVGDEGHTLEARARAELLEGYLPKVLSSGCPARA